MASFTINLFESRAPRGKRVIITCILEQVDLQETVDGEVIWILRMQTNSNGFGSVPIDPVYLLDVTQKTLTDEIRKGASIIGDQIDWTNIEEDTAPPYIQSLSPGVNEENVAITSIVQARLRDAFPTVGIDPSTIKLRVNGIDVTTDITIGGVDNDYTVTWIPPKKLD